MAVLGTPYGELKVRGTLPACTLNVGSAVPAAPGRAKAISGSAGLRSNLSQTI